MPHNIHPWLLRIRAHGWLFLALIGLGLLVPAGVALAAGDASGCDDLAPSGWTRTIWWVDSQSWSPGRVGPWNNGTTVSVQESNAYGSTCDSSGPGEAYQDGQPWWGTFRTDYVVTGRGVADPAPYGRHRFARDTWWDGWQRPAIGGQKVAGYWLKSTGPGVGDESVFVASDREIWTEIGSFSVEARCMSPSGPLVSVSFSARNSSGSWSASGSGTNWSVTNAAGPGPWTVSASGFGWSGSTTLHDGGSYTFVVTGCGSASGGVSVEAHCNSTTGPLVNAGAFDAWEEKYWQSGGWYASAGYGSSASFSVPAGASTPIHVRVWWTDGSQAQATTTVGSVVRFVTTNPSLCLSTTPTTNQTPTPPPPAPCTAGAGAYDGSYINVWANIANGAGTVHNTGDGTEWKPPTGAANQVSVSPNQPLTITLDHLLRGQGYGVDHDGRTRVIYGIRDITGGSNTNLVYVETADEKELKDSAGVVHVWAYSAKVVKAEIASGVSFGGAARWRRWQRNWANWSYGEVTPALNTYLYDTGGQTTITFTPQNGRTYEVYVMAGHGACAIQPNQRWSRLLIHARQMRVSLIEANLDGSIKGPIANQGMVWVSYAADGSYWSPRYLPTDTQGNATFTMETGRRAGIWPGSEGYAASNIAMRGWVLWKAQHDCVGATRTNQLGTYKGFWDPSNPCNVTLYYVRVPTISASARHEQTSAALPNVPIVLTNSYGGWLRNQNTDGAGNTTFTFAESEILPQIGAASNYWRVVAAATAPPNIPIFRAVAGSHALVKAKDLIHITPAQSSSGNTFFYKPPMRSLAISGSVRTAVTAPDPDKPVGNATVRIVVRNSVAILDQRSVATDASGNYSYSNPSLPDDQTLSVEIHLDSWSGSAYSGYIANQAYPGTVSPGSAGSVTRSNNRLLRLTLAANTGAVSTAGNTFDLTNLVPPPQAPTLDWKLFVHSRYDGNNVYLSDNDQITWPEGETLDWMPQITTTPAPNESIGGETYRFDAKVVAWSFVGSETTTATGADAMSRSGCRARHKPTWDGGNETMLDGCSYFYDMSYATTTPTADELNQQAHAFWGMQTPQDMESWIYVLQLDKLKRVELRVQALVKVQAVKLANPATGTAELPVGNPAFIKVDKTFYVNLVAPRSTR